MKNFFDSIIRTPGILFMAVMTLGFTINAGVQYINATGFEGPNLMAAACLVFGQFIVITVHQLRKIGQSSKLNLQ